MEPTSQGEVYAELEINSSKFSIEKLQGKEAVNQLFRFTLNFFANELFNENQWLGQSAFLSIHFPQGKRRFKAIVYRLKSYPLSDQTNRYHIECELRANLCLLSLNGRPTCYPESSLQQLMGRLISTTLSFDWIAPERGLERQEHWLQVENEDDLSFFKRVLADYGVNFLCNCSNDDEADVLFFEENPGFQQPFENPFYCRSKANWAEFQADGLFELVIKENLAGHSLIYRSMDPEGRQDYIEASAGSGQLKSMFWGISATSDLELFRKITNHHQALQLQKKIFYASSQQPCLAAGQLFEGRNFPKTVQASHFVVLEVEHLFENGQYKNQLMFVDEKQAVRPLPIRMMQGQKVKTASIKADGMNPLLDENGGYGFQNHLYQYDKQQPLPRAGRITPYLERGTDKPPAGLHFPLESGAEVLSLSLHGDPQQSMLQNSPANAIYPAPVRAHNPWTTLLKSAWGQYLMFVEKDNKTDIHLANASGRNALKFIENDIELNSEAGLIQMKSNGQMTVSAEGKSSFQTEQHEFITAKKHGDLQGKTIHLQAVKADFEANRDIEVKVGAELETSIRQLLIQTGNSLEFSAQAQDLQAEIAKGDFFLQVDELCLMANQRLSIGLNDSKIELTEHSLQIHADSIHFNTQNLQWRSRVNYCPSAAAALPFSAALSLPALSTVKQYKNKQPKGLGLPEWESSFYHLSDTASIQFEISGFEASDSVSLFLYCADIMDVSRLSSANPYPGELPEAKLIESRSYELAHQGYYLEKEAAFFTAGTGRLRIDYPLQHLTDNEDNKTVYFIKLQVADFMAQRFSNPMMILAPAEIELRPDKDMPLLNTASLMEIRRCLPESLRKLSDSPEPLTPYFYHPLINVKNLPAGHRNRLSLISSGIYQELYISGQTPPALQLPFEVDIAKTNHRKIKRLMPSMRINLHHAYLDEENSIAFSREEPEARAYLSSEEIEYIKANQEHLTIFIHGYNVPYGRFGQHFNEEEGGLQSSDVAASIYRDNDYFTRIYEDYGKKNIEKEKNLNGSGMHSWITHLEQNLNKAAGMESGDYSAFTRCLFIGWPGNPVTPLGYNKAVRASIASAPVLARLFENIQQQLPGIKLHVIAHSLGCGLLIQAMNCLGKKRKLPLLEHVFFCQPSIPEGAFKTYGISTVDSLQYQQVKIRHQHNPWFCPFAHKASRYIQVFHSRNDNILGPMLSRSKQPPGLSRMEVIKKKPMDEILALLFARFTGTESIYMASNLIGQPVSELLHESGLQKAWHQIISQHPCMNIAGRQEQCQPGLSSQLKLLETMGIYVLFREQRIKRGLRHLFKAVKMLHQKKLLPTVEHISASSLLNTLLNKAKKSTSLKEDLNHFYHAHRGFIRQLLTFLQSIHLLNDALLQPAMGYVGADWKNDAVLQGLLASGYVKNIDTTSFIWHHSHMKEVEKKIQDELFAEGILSAREMVFY